MSGPSRRAFLASAAAACVACLAGPGGLARAGRELGMAPGLMGVRPSPFYTPLPDRMVRCTLCPHGCELAPGETGQCRVRRNIDGVQHTLVYGNPCAVHLDPIEKKPFFHVLPASASLSLATAGCNFDCRFCQNWEISQKGPEETINMRLPPARAAEEALRAQAASIASTYVEPTVFMEYMLDVGRQARARGLLNVMHSNGFVNPGPLAGLIKVLDAACIDLKSMDPGFYRDVCSGELAPVKASLRALKAAGVHVEIVHLMIPGLNDSPAQTTELARFVAGELGTDVPLHLTRFFPRYKLANLPPTPVATLERARKLALAAGLEYVYLGNVPGHPAESTFCPGCGALLIERLGYRVRSNNLKAGACPKCGHAVPGIWERRGKGA